MPAVLGDGLTMVKAALPGLVGTNKRWSDELVRTLLVAADRQIRERLGAHYHEQEISLADNTASYALDPEFVGISLVEFSLDGSNYDWEVWAASYDEFDAAHAKWRTVRSGRPTLYNLASCPGLQAPFALDAAKLSRIIIYPCPSTAGSSKIRVSGYGVVSVADQDSATMPLDVLKKCHVPLVLSVLYHKESPKDSVAYLEQFESGCTTVRDRFFANRMESRARGGG